MSNKHTSSDEPDWLGEILEMVYSETRQQIQDYGNHKTPKLKKEFMIRAKAQVEAYIKANYILRADVVEAIGGYEEPEGRTIGPGMPSFQRDQLRRSIRESLNLEGEQE